MEDDRIILELKKGAKLNNLILAKIPSGYGTFARNVVLSEANSMEYDSCGDCSCGKKGCFRIWNFNDENWIDYCKRCFISLMDLELENDMIDGTCNYCTNIDNLEVLQCIDCNKSYCVNDMGGTCRACGKFCLCYRCGHRKEKERNIHHNYSHSIWIDNLCEKCT